MTEQKTFKRSVRARMEKTGESYSTARRQLLKKAEHEAEAASVDDYEAPVSDEAIERNTGRRSGEWFAILDSWGAAERSHRDVARHLTEKHGVDGWWAQSVTVMYEQARGLRAKGQRADGTFEATASKTVAVPLEELFRGFVDESRREDWLPGDGLSLRGATEPKSARFDWEGGPTRVVAGFLAKGEGKSQVAIAHQRLPDAKARETMKAFWRERLAALKEALEA
jgi:uncharacterized protein YndB with AHSA1/START domain